MKRNVILAVASAFAGVAAVASAAGAVTVLPQPGGNPAVHRVADWDGPLPPPRRGPPRDYGYDYPPPPPRRGPPPYYYREGPPTVIIGGGGSRCQKWKGICGDRYGWRTRGYFRCLDEHDAC